MSTDWSYEADRKKSFFIFFCFGHFENFYKYRVNYKTKLKTFTSIETIENLSIRWKISKTKKIITSLFRIVERRNQKWESPLRNLPTSKHFSRDRRWKFYLKCPPLVKIFRVVVNQKKTKKSPWILVWFWSWCREQIASTIYANVQGNLTKTQSYFNFFHSNNS